jgi:hypothetical protein
VLIWLGLVGSIVSFELWLGCTSLVYSIPYLIQVKIRFKLDFKFKIFWVFFIKLANGLIIMVFILL